MRFLKPYRGIAILGTACKFLEAVLELIIPLFMARLIDRGIGSADGAFIIRMGTVMLVLAVVGAGSAYICQYLASVTSQCTGTDIRNAIFEKINVLEYEQLDKFSTASLVNRVTNDVKDLQYAVAMLIRLVVRVPFLCVGGLVMAFVINWKLALILVFAMPLFLLVIFFVMRKNSRLYRSVQRELDGLGLSTKESLSGARVIRAFSKSDEMSAKFRAKNAEYVRIQRKSIRVSAFFNPVTTLIINAAIIAILYFGGVQVNEDLLTKGEIIAFINYVNIILQALIVLANLVITFTKAGAAWVRVNEILDTPVEKEGTLPLQKTDAPQIEFDHVTFSYTEGGDPELEDITFSVQAGETLGVIGGTGSGKSTLLALLLKFYRPGSGQIRLYGRDLAEIDRDQLLREVGYVPQRAVLFSGTVGDNIRMGDPEASDEAVERAVDLSQCREILARMPRGLDTEVERGGVNLSGGQRQRITIARALVKREADLILFDDSFSALDYATDLKLRRAVRGAFSCTKVFVSQRVSAIRDADKILVLKEGRAVGFDTHERLLQTCETYREIEQSQRSLS